MKRPSNDKLIMWGLLFAALVGLTVCFLHREYSLGSVLSSIKTADPLWLLPGILSMALFFFCEGVNIGRCLKLAGHDVPLTAKIRYAMAGFFFSSVTPSASGGQPMQIYFMHRDGLPLSHSSLALLTELTSFQAAAAALAITGFAGRCSRVLGPGPSTAARGAVTTAILLVGFLISAAVLALLLALIFSPAAVRIAASPVLYITEKISPQNAYAIKYRLLRGLSEYRRASRCVTKNPRAVAGIFITSIVQLLAFFSITFCVCKSLGISHISWFEMTMTQAVLYTAVSALPLPGAVGVTEGGFVLLFAASIPAELMGVAVVLCRFVSFGLPLIVSGVGTFLMNSRPAA